MPSKYGKVMEFLGYDLALAEAHSQQNFVVPPILILSLNNRQKTRSMRLPTPSKEEIKKKIHKRKKDIVVPPILILSLNNRQRTRTMRLPTPSKEEISSNGSLDS